MYFILFALLSPSLSVCVCCLLFQCVWCVCVCSPCCNRVVQSRVLTKHPLTRCFGKIDVSNVAATQVAHKMLNYLWISPRASGRQTPPPTHLRPLVFCFTRSPNTLLSPPGGVTCRSTKGHGHRLKYHNDNRCRNISWTTITNTSTDIQRQCTKTRCAREM